MQVLFRADASQALGGGHIRRCLSLAGALEAFGAQTLFIVAGTDIDYTGLGLPDTGRIEIAGDDREGAATLAALNTADGSAPDVAIVDHYALDARWHDAIRKGTGAAIVGIDDLADRPLHCDLLVDHNWHRDHRAKYGRVAGDVAKILGGPRFALLDPAYRDIARAPVEETVASIGIFTGATDPEGSTQAALDAVVRSGFEGMVEVVSTSANPRLGQLRAAVARQDKATLVTDLPHLAGFMSRHGLQIGSGGGATWERCAAGAPTIAAITADNQTASLPALAENGVVRLHGKRPIDTGTLAAEIADLIGNRSLRAQLAERSRALVDGRGAMRVAAAILPMRLRKAAARDSAMAYAWRNAPQTRALSNDPSPIERSGHEGWWHRAIANPDRHLLFCEIGARPVGVLRFDFDSGGVGGEALVSIYFDPAMTGLGLGRRLLDAGRDWLIRADPRARRLVAEIDDANHASLAIFARAGYTPAADGTYRLTIAGPSQ